MKRILVKLFATLLCIGIFLFLAAGSLPGDGPSDTGRTGQLNLEESVYRGAASVEPSGGTLQIGNPESDIYGFKISVPDGAYRHTVDFGISETPIGSHTFGDDFNPVTPLITVENGGVWSDIPVTVTVPIEKEDDELAMGFYYDREIGQLEAIPFLEQTNDHIILFTSHFSDIVISKIEKGRIVDEIDTGFKLLRDNIQTPNYGSIVAPGGHCAGQSIAAMYYYYNRHRIGWDKILYGRFDNDYGEATPYFWMDDAKIIRLSSALQSEMAYTWEHEWQGKLKPYFDILGEDDEQTFYAFAYAMQMTENPQFLYMAQSEKVEPDRIKRSAHAIIAYKIEKNTIFLSDPNFPQAYEGREVVLKREPGQTPSFTPIDAAINAAASPVKYDRIGFFGAFSLVNKNTAYHYWQQVKAGGPVATDLFPPDVEIEVALDRNEHGQLVTALLSDELTLTKQGTDSIGSGSEGRLYWRISNSDPSVQDGVSFYREQESVTQTQEEGWNHFALEPGVNELGLLHKQYNSQIKRWLYVNFRKFHVHYIDQEQEETAEVRTYSPYKPEDWNSRSAKDLLETGASPDRTILNGTWEVVYLNALNSNPVNHWLTHNVFEINIQMHNADIATNDNMGTATVGGHSATIWWHHSDFRFRISLTDWYDGTPMDVIFHIQGVRNETFAEDLGVHIVGGHFGILMERPDETYWSYGFTASKK